MTPEKLGLFRQVRVFLHKQDDLGLDPGEEPFKDGDQRLDAVSDIFVQRMVLPALFGLHGAPEFGPPPEKGAKSVLGGAWRLIKLQVDPVCDRSPPLFPMAIGKRGQGLCDSAKKQKIPTAP